MKKLIIVSDFDGTWAKIKPLIEELGISPYIITGRSEEEIAIVKEKLNGIKIKGFYHYPHRYCDDLDDHLKKIAHWKAKMVRKLNANIYIDDDHRVLREVSKLNPGTICLEVF
jgi:hypothetical protein